MQTDYGDNFINLMLGWVRNLASGIMEAFQSTSGSSSSSGVAILDWFAAHWLTLLIVLIVLGVLTDWIVWMLRWRPYWLWFHKKRIVLEDDIDQPLSDDMLHSRYRANEPGARFHSVARKRSDDYDEYDDGLYATEVGYANDRTRAYDYDTYDDGQYIDDGEYEYEDGVYDEDEYDDVYEGEYEDDEEYEYEDDDEYEDGEIGDDAFEAGDEYDDEYDDEDKYDEEDDEYEDGDDDNEAEDEWDDLPPRRRSSQSTKQLPVKIVKQRIGSIFGRKHVEEEEEDPFAVDEGEFGDLDDDFYSVVSEEPHYQADEGLGFSSIALNEEEPEPVQIQPLDDADAGDWDERVGYRSSFQPLTGTKQSRKSRRKGQEGEGGV